MVRVIGLWNFRLLGSMVTIGDTATRLPSSLAVMSVGIGWACKKNGRLNYKHVTNPHSTVDIFFNVGGIQIFLIDRNT